MKGSYDLVPSPVGGIVGCRPPENNLKIYLKTIKYFWRLGFVVVLWEQVSFCPNPFLSRIEKSPTSNWGGGGGGETNKPHLR